MGHRLVLSNNAKKWLSLDGVNLIKKTVDDFEETKHADCGNIFQDALKRHGIAVLKTCQRDEDITTCSAGFCITDSFLNIDRKDETAAALASLEKQIGMPIKQAPGGAPGAGGRELKPNEIQVTILARRPKPQPAAAASAGFPRVITPGRVGGGVTGGYLKRTPQPQHVPLKSTVLNVGEKTKRGGVAAASPAKAAAAAASSEDEETVSAIQSFLDSTSGKEGNRAELKVPAGIKITPAGRGTVNIRAVADGDVGSPRPAATLEGLSPATVVTRGGQRVPTAAGEGEGEGGRMPGAGGSPSKGGGGGGGGGGLKPGTMVTLTANGVVAKVVAGTAQGEVGEGEEEEDDDEFADLSAALEGGAEEGEGDFEEEETPRPPKRTSKKRARSSGGGGGGGGAEEDKDYKSPAAKQRPPPPPPPPLPVTTTTPLSPEASSSLDTSASDTPSRSRRQRKEKKIFDL